MDRLRGVYEVPLGLASLAGHQFMRKLVYRFGQRAYRRSPETFRRWNVLSGELLDQPHQLSRYMIVAPRWNPHAVVGSAGPIRVERELAIDCAGMGPGVEYWSFGAYHFPSFKPMAHVSSLSRDPGAGTIRLALPPGDYYVGCRLYARPGVERALHYPALEVDGAKAIEPFDIEPGANDFYAGLARQGGRIYRAIHFHMFVLLKYRGLLPTGFVERTLLPVGNEDTRYVYGIVRRGEVLTIASDPVLLAACRVFCTVYDTASMPIAAFEVTDPAHVSAPVPARGIYLIRLMRTDPREPAGALGPAMIAVTAGAPAMPHKGES